MKGIRKILVAVNNSINLVNQGVRLAGEESAWLTVVKVFPPYEGELHLTGIRNISDALRAGSDSMTAAIKELATKERAQIKTRMETGAIDRRILEVAAEEHCDLIVMGAQKVGLMKRIMGANVVERVIAHAPCPVFVVGG